MDLSHDGNLDFLNTMRIRVALTLDNLLPTGFTNQKNDGFIQRIKFRIEKLPDLCYLCGIMGHLRRNYSNKILLQALIWVLVHG